MLILGMPNYVPLNETNITWCNSDVFVWWWFEFRYQNDSRLSVWW